MVKYLPLLLIVTHTKRVYTVIGLVWREQRLRLRSETDERMSGKERRLFFAENERDFRHVIVDGLQSPDLDVSEYP